MNNAAASSVPCPATHRSGKEVAPFLKNLRAMLESENPAILRWTSDGRAFEIHDLQQMSDRVLPKYFKHAKYTSFQRQLNYFSFRKWTKSKAEVCTFSNAFFVRDQPSLSGHISRKKSVPSHLKVPSNKAQRSKRKQNEEVEKEKEHVQEQRFLFHQQYQHHHQLSLPSPRSDMTIKLPALTAANAEHLSFSSPTEVYSSEIAFPQLGYDNDQDDVYGDSSSSSSGDDFESIELDWVDTLYSSLTAKSELDSAAAVTICCDPSAARHTTSSSNSSFFDLRL